MDSIESPNVVPRDRDRPRSVWSAPTAGPFPPLRKDASTGVVVIGAGITGLLAATLLGEAGHEVLVVDRAEIGGVATRNTTAKISALQGTVLRSIRSHRGGEAASAYAAAQLDAVHGIRGIVDALEIRCDLTQAPAFTYATEPDAAEAAHEEYEAALAAGLPVDWVDDTELPFSVRGAVRLDRQLHFDPLAFCSGLAEHLGSEHVAERTTVLGVEEGRDCCTVALAGGATITCDHVVVASQGPIVDPAFLANRCTPMQSYAIAARMSGPVPVGMYLSCDRASRSLRPAVLDGAPVAVVGGEGHHMGDDEATPERWAALRRWTEQHFGPVEQTHRWATHDLVPTDHVPFVGRLASAARSRWVATGFAKWGMTNGYVAARLLTEAINGRELPWTSTFDATRLSASVNTGLVSIGASTARHLVVDRVTRRGAPRCSHQGCVLREDAALGTWDCPCHGSRFDAAGSVIQGPATAPVDVARTSR